jgi:transposase
MANHAASALVCDPSQRTRLERLEANGATPQKLALRARMILRAAEGMANLAIAKELGVSRPTVLLWRERFASLGVPGIMADAARPGRKPALPPEKVQAVVEATLHTRPAGQTHWSVRAMAKAQGLSRMAVQRIWTAHHLQPHRVGRFKLSRDKRFVEKLRDLVGLYLSPPEKALVLSVDEKSRIQALDRTQPGLPMKKGRCGTRTHDYKRNGATTLFAALNMLDGKVLGECLPRHRAKEFVKFLLHFIPTSSSWLNMIERWFRNITDQAIRRGVFQSVPSLIAAIQRYLDAHNADPNIFTWTQDADTILAKIAKCKEALGTLH